MPVALVPLVRVPLVLVALVLGMASPALRLRTSPSAREAVETSSWRKVPRNDAEAVRRAQVIELETPTERTSWSGGIEDREADAQAGRLAGETIEDVERLGDSDERWFDASVGKCASERSQKCSARYAVIVPS